MSSIQRLSSQAFSMHVPAEQSDFADRRQGGGLSSSYVSRCMTYSLHKKHKLESERVFGHQRKCISAVDVGKVKSCMRYKIQGAPRLGMAL